MLKLIRIIPFLALFSLSNSLSYTQTYEPNWKSLDSRPVPKWFTDAKFGIFIHWGVYSVPSYRPVSSKMYETYAEWYEAKVMHDGGLGEAFHKNNFGTDFSYRDFAEMFTTELFEPEYWAELFQRAGAKYVVLTSKHHDGFCLWPSNSPYKKDWNSMDVGPKQDLLKELSHAVRNKGLKMGIYYSLMEWESTPRNHEWSGGKDGYYLPEHIIKKYQIPDPDFVEKNIIPELKNLVLNYEPALIFADGEWDKPSEYWKSQEFLAWLYNRAPNKEEIVVNDRWGVDTRGRHGGYFTSEYSSDDHMMSAMHPWEESRGIGLSYGYNRAENIDDYSSSHHLILQLIDIVSRGGNLLLNIGPTADGRIPVIQQQRLIDIGSWLAINGYAIYESSAYKTPKISTPDGTYYFTQKGKDLYIIIDALKKPTFSIPLKGIVNPEHVIYLGDQQNIDYMYKNDHLSLEIQCERIMQKSTSYPVVIQLKNAIK